MASISELHQQLLAVLEWLSARWIGIRLYLKLVVPCWLAALITLAISIAMLHPQTVDALAAVAEERGFLSQQQLASLFTLIVFACSVWYMARALLYVRYAGGPDDSALTANHHRVLKWLPRVLGVLPIVAVSLAFLRSRNFVFMIIYVAIAAAFVFILHQRRKWLESSSDRAPADEVPGSRVFNKRSLNLPRTTFRIVIGTLLAAFLSLALVVISPVAVPSSIGPLGMVYLAGAGWVIVGSALLVYPTRRFQLPSLFVILLVMSGVFGIWNDNHGVTPLEGTIGEVNDRPTLHQQFDRWLGRRGTSDTTGEPYPVFVVTAEGGGIRAAYWTAAVLNAITSSAPEFPCHVFALSGVSGGSLGAAAYAARLADVYFLDDNPGDLCRKPMSRRIEQKRSGAEVTSTQSRQFHQDASSLGVELEALGQDFLSPVLAGMLFPDLTQRMFPIAFLPDRASYLERSWESAWPKAWHAEKAAGNSVAREFTDRGRASRDDNRFRRNFLGLWDDELSVLTPSLFLNATRVETGERVIVSNVRIADAAERTETQRGPFGFAVDLLDRMGGSVKLSQAVHFSARFTYLSPAATIVDRTNGESARIVDGGYFENSGAITASELVDRLRAECEPANATPRCRVHVLIISNNVRNPNAWQQDRISLMIPGDDGACGCAEGQPGCSQSHDHTSDDSHSAPGTAAFFSETLSPVRTLFATRSARGFLAEEQLFRKMPCRTYRAQLRDIGERNIPLGWILSDSLRASIESQATNTPATIFIAEKVSKFWSHRSISGTDTSGTAQ